MGAGSLRRQPPPGRCAGFCIRAEMLSAYFQTCYMLSFIHLFRNGWKLFRAEFLLQASVEKNQKQVLIWLLQIYKAFICLLA